MTMTSSAAIAPQTIHGMLYHGIKAYVFMQRNDVAPHTRWTGGAAHEEWLDMLNSIKPGYEKVLGKRIKAFGSPSKEECNAFLKQEGFDIELDDFIGEQPVGGVCVLHIGVEWLFEGEETSIIGPSKDGGSERYDGVLLTGGLTYLTSSEHEHPIVQIATKGPESVFMTLADKPLDGVALLKRISAISKSTQIDHHAYFQGLKFPMVDLDVQPDISGLCGIQLARTAGKPYELFQAIAQVKFKANHLGAQTDAAAAGQAGFECMPSYVTLNKPFYVWKSIPGLNYPVLAAYVAEDSWKNPGNFELNNG